MGVDNDWRRLLRVPWIARRSNQSILRRIVALTRGYIRKHSLEEISAAEHHTL